MFKKIIIVGLLLYTGLLTYLFGTAWINEIPSKEKESPTSPVPQPKFLDRMHGKEVSLIPGNGCYTINIFGYTTRRFKSPTAVTGQYHEDIIKSVTEKSYGILIETEKNGTIGTNNFAILKATCKPVP